MNDEEMFQIIKEKGLEELQKTTEVDISWDELKQQLKKEGFWKDEK